MVNLLLIEDDIAIRKELCELLTRLGYNVVIMDDFDNYMSYFVERTYQGILLDITLPNISGFSICRKIKELYSVPIIFVTSSHKEEDELKSILSGGDDFVTKPYNVSILLEKIKRVVAKNPLSSSIITIKNVTFDLSSSTLSFNGKSVELSRNERKIMYYLFQNVNRLVTKDELIEFLWNDKYYVDESILLVNINRLRKKLEEIDQIDFIKTVWGKGYQI